MSVSNRAQRVYRYVIDHDRGFAPNPFFGLCTLACCKPDIRKHAAVGDIIVGFGPAKYEFGGRIIYWMKVQQITDFDSYWRDPNYTIKRPQMGGSLSLCFGDNIYHRKENADEWTQENSFHSDKMSRSGGGNLERDTGRTDHVLIGSEFIYWGSEAKTIPKEFKELIHRGRGYTYNIDDNQLQTRFVKWLKHFPYRGFQHEPADWSRDKKLKQLLGA